MEEKTLTATVVFVLVVSITIFAVVQITVLQFLIPPYCAFLKFLVDVN